MVPYGALCCALGMNRSIHWQEYLDNGYLAVNLTTGSACSTLVKDGTCGDNFWRYNTPTNNALVDSTNPKGMARTFEHWWEGYGQYGVRAMWMDESEPDHAAYISGGQWDLFAGTDAEILPAWVHYWIKGISDGMNSIGAAPGEYFILSRNAWAGTWSYGGALWSGDIGSNWHELETAVTVGQGASMSGVALWTTDVRKAPHPMPFRLYVLLHRGALNCFVLLRVLIERRLEGMRAAIPTAHLSNR